MSGKRAQNVCQINRQGAVDLDDGDDLTNFKEERESYSSERRNDIDTETDQKGQMLNRQAEGSFVKSPADSDFIKASHTDKDRFSSPIDEKESTAKEREIKCGQLQFLRRDNFVRLKEATEAASSSGEFRHFRLTKDSFICFQKDSEAEVEHSYHLSNVEKLDYADVINPLSFHIVFPTFTIVLQAETQEKAKDWVEKINTALKYYEPGRKQLDSQQATISAGKDNREAEKNDEIHVVMQECLPDIENMEQESTRNDDKQQLLTESKSIKHPQGTQSKKLPFLKELQTSRERSPCQDLSITFSNPIELPPPSTPNTVTEDTDKRCTEGTIKTGLLSKTSIGRREGSRPGPTRYRHFRLTEVALEYLHQFSHVKVKRSFPLTSVEEVEYDEGNDPTTFRLIFSNCIEVLQAETRKEANDWVEKIVEVCKRWHPLQVKESFDEPSEPEEEEVNGASSINDQTQMKPNDEISPESRVKTDHDIESAPSAPAKCRFSAPKFRQRSFTTPASMLLSDHHHDRYDLEDSRDAFTTRWRIRLWSKNAKEKLVPRSDKSASSAVDTTYVDFRTNYPMIKYPRHMLGLPNEKLFRMDSHNMQIMWRRNHRSRFHQSRSLSLHKVVEVREGQKTAMFDKFPFDQVDEQSFSLIYQQEDKRYAYLTSLNVICDQPESYKLWINELKSKVKGQSNSCTHPRLSSQDDDTTDTTLLWLKQLWSCKSDKDGELSEREAIKLARKINPFVTEQFAKETVVNAHQHQVGSSHGQSLEFSGFVLVYNLLDSITDCRLHSIFKEYAKESPHLGMTLSEFREFLINECCWQRKSCTKAALRKLMLSHDSYHDAYKKYTASNNPADFVASYKRFSFAGFISFLRSKDNPAIDPKHETVYQDMTQPLSHYFINSSHNTYLEGHQLNGKSSTEAYTRVLLQGCRCIEIDCWDDTLNVTKLPEKEPIIYHGFTLTTKLPFRDVIHTIRDYAFHSSPFPVVISIENHCNKTNQAKMAMIFRAIFDEMLPQKDLVELEGRERLPSPEELREKIILKSPIKEEEPTDKGTMKRKSSKLPHTNSTLSESLPKNNTSKLQTDQTNESDGATTEECDAAKFNKGPLRLSFRTRRKQLGEIQKRVEELEQGKDDQEVEFIETVEDLSSLIIYAKCKYIKPWDWEEQRKTKVNQLLSFGEPTAVKLCTVSSREMLAATERQLVRTYPKGTRFDSSNYYPFVMWARGIQMATLNFQTLDIYMHLNQGFFRLNGGCGYVLKPAVMRREDPGGGATPFDPEMQTPHPDVPMVDLEIELISGQRLCPWKKKRSSVSVLIHTYGITHDCAHIKEATHDRPLWPHWEKGRHNLKKSIIMPELCLVYFRVEADKKLFGQNCIPVISLQSGIKFIPLRTPGGELIPGSGLFVQIKKTTAATTSETSDRGAAKDGSSEHLVGQITRQKTIDIEQESITDAAKATTKDEESVKPESDDYEGKIDSDDPEASLCKRRFTSPASFERSDDPFKDYDSSKLTVIAEVHENTAQ